MPRTYIPVTPPGGYPPRICNGCGQEYTPRRADQVNCTKSCGTARDNFEKARAQKAYRALYHWRLNGGRMGKTPRGAGIGEISRLVQAWIDEDKKEGRAVPALPYTNR